MKSRFQTLVAALCAKANGRPMAAKIFRSDILGFENNLAASFQSSLHQVLDYLLLAVNRDASSSSKFMKIDPVPLALEEQFDAVMSQAQRPSLLSADPEELPTGDEIAAELEQFLAEQDGSAES